ncbi:MAG: 1-(5-phosphoribosyl)-5-[(5-phosphoribosylamino)methylideneamino]imidazole-4-carboxamide isomerase [bacterium]|nr:1-(5-phosphoribosyl)-5-[(5-phosphoribosylamino)methylideneamino]imidazole-4-carboxamide isomerase [Candidatus Sumerlaeota bacterium]
MNIIPAIDLMSGGVVRLEQGDASRKIVYAETPAGMARAFEAAGARRIHVVDLDGAFSGEPKNLEAIRAIRAATHAQIEVGGGIRSRAHAETLIAEGVDYIVIGTKALEDPEFLAEMMRAHGGRVIVGADARDGCLSARGWTAGTQIKTAPYLARLRNEMGVHTVIFTDIARDGMFTSPNYAALGEVLAVEGLNVIASGGVGTLDDLRALHALNNPNLTGVIVGRALCDGRISLRDAIKTADDQIP